MPVSSETMTLTASVDSVMPMAARWRVPSSREREWSSVSCKMQAAATMRSPRTITAPSCKGVFGSKMFSISGAEISPSMTVPESMTSASPVCRSKTIRAPMRFLDMLFSARTTS